LVFSALPMNQIKLPQISIRQRLIAKAARSASQRSSSTSLSSCLAPNSMRLLVQAVWK